MRWDKTETQTEKRVSKKLAVDILMGIFWGIVISLITMSPNVFSDGIDFVYANF